MTITAKEIRTQIHVEFTKEEFVENYIEMMDSIMDRKWIDDRVNTNTIETQLNRFIKLNRKGQVDLAEDSFNNVFGLLHIATIRYMAYKCNMNVDNYGYQRNNIGYAVFWMRGAYI